MMYRFIAARLLLLCTEIEFGQVTYQTVALAIPQLAIGGYAGGQNYVTLVQLINTNSAQTTGHLTLYSDTGSALTALFDGQGPQGTMDITLASGETRQIQVTLNGPITAGWMLISYSPSDAL